MSTAPKRYFSAAEYLALERKASYKSEFLRGEIFAMAGASKEHVTIVNNIGGELRARLKGRPCDVFGTDMRLKVDRTGLYTYPDITAVCGEAKFEPSAVDTLLNPQVLFEVLSPSTEAYDRGAKFGHYRQVPSLRDYVVVSQDKCLIEHFVRQPDDSWLLTVFDNMAQTVPLPALACELPLAEIYYRIEFPSPDAARPNLENV